MIIDVQTHIWNSTEQLGPEYAARLRATKPEHWGQLDASPEAHDQAMRCVDGAFVLGFRSRLLGAEVPNEFIADYVRRAPERRIGIAGIDPMDDDALDRLEAAVALGLTGITVSPAAQGFHPAHSAAMRIYERCLETSMPLFVTAKGTPTTSARLEFARPALWDEVARVFPALPIVIGQLGHPWIDETLLLLGKHENVWADTSSVAARPWQLYNALLSASSFGVMDRILFASNFPFELPEKTIESLYSINGFSHGTQLPAVSRSLIRGIVERDVPHCLGLDTEIRSRPSDDTDEERPAAQVPAPAPSLAAEPSHED